MKGSGCREVTPRGKGAKSKAGGGLVAERAGSGRARGGLGARRARFTLLSCCSLVLWLWASH